MSEMTLEETLYTQVHKQYLENDHLKTSTIITYLGAITFVFTAYGYVYSYPYYHSDVTFSYVTLLRYTTLAAFLILSFLAILSVNLGYSSRKEHHTSHYIYKKKMSISETENLFSKKLGNMKGLLGFLPDYYFILFVYFNISIIALCYASHNYDISILHSSGTGKSCYKCYCDYVSSIRLLPFICLVTIIINIIVYCYYYVKYINLKNK